MLMRLVLDKITARVNPLPGVLTAGYLAAVGIVGAYLTLVAWPETVVRCLSVGLPLGLLWTLFMICLARRGRKEEPL